ncbi:O-antigen ligase-like membrane protein [Micromonospora pisi]|uniref:O-antigen ligase-like membrane protein n=1 Tax=Micromonospora pisi TaxID=589240 RepID=A0A495JT28_9ACTN|nr:O-antigen ligase family protein [Micromonospora pisi]RKR91229.1 O-antigen ligase-like membrane protein [Micromonospora pisi]
MRTSAESGADACVGDALEQEHGGVALPGHVVVLIVALSAAVVAQGGYYPAGRILVTVLVAVALVAALRLRPRVEVDARMVALACAALAGWVLVRAVIADAYEVAFGAVGTLAGVAAVALILARTSVGERIRGAEAVIGLGVLVSVTAWAGVAWRLPRFAVLVEGRLWRGASTLTYPNAAAALLVPLALLALALLLTRPRSLPLALAGYLLLVGTGATLSRAGLIALLAGLMVLAATAGLWSTISRAGPLLLGAGIAVVAVVPSTPGTAQPQPALAAIGLVSGALIVTGSVLLPTRVRGGAMVGALLLGAIALASQWGSDPLRAVLASRGNLDSPGRSGAATAALELVGANPLIGTGIGQARFLWVTPNGNGALALYAHNEYLQLLVDLGLIGALLLMALFATMAVAIRRGGAHQRRAGIRAGVFAALTAFAVHSGFDFLWHIAVLPLLGALLVGLAAPAIRGNPSSSTTKEKA